MNHRINARAPTTTITTPLGAVHLTAKPMYAASIDLSAVCVPHKHCFWEMSQLHYATITITTSSNWILFVSPSSSSKMRPHSKKFIYYSYPMNDKKLLTLNKKKIQ